MIIAGGAFAGTSLLVLSGVALPSGPIVVVVANEAGSYKTVSHVGHSAISGAQRIGDLYQSILGNNIGHTIEIWGASSSGGTGNLQVQMSGTIDYGALWVLQVPSLNEIGRVTRTNFQWVNSFQLASPAAGFGVAVVYGPMGGEAATVDITGWDDGTDLRKPGTWRAGRVAFEASAMQGQQVNFVGNGGSINPLAMLCVFGSGGSGGGNAALIRGI